MERASNGNGISQKVMQKEVGLKKPNREIRTGHLYLLNKRMVKTSKQAALVNVIWGWGQKLKEKSKKGAKRGEAYVAFPILCDPQTPKGSSNYEPQVASAAV